MVYMGARVVLQSEARFFSCMIKEIERICPEEGQLDIQSNDTDMNTNDNSMQVMTE
jgi:hypothetical protein